MTPRSAVFKGSPEVIKVFNLPTVQKKFLVTKFPEISETEKTVTAEYIELQLKQVKFPRE